MKWHRQGALPARAIHSDGKAQRSSVQRRSGHARILAPAMARIPVRDRAADGAQARLRLRLSVAMALVVLGFGILFARFYYLQVTRYDAYHATAESNRITFLPIAPQRGQIVDRAGRALAENVVVQTLEIAPARVSHLEQTIAGLSQVVAISAVEKRRFRRLLNGAKLTDTVPLKMRLTDQEVARIAAVLFRFEGVEVKARSYRRYPMGAATAHVVGHIGRISTADQERLEQQTLSSLYAGSTHIGKVGIEQQYEQLLHGQPGVQEVEVSASGKPVRALAHRNARSGNNLKLTIDTRLQQLIQAWYGDRRGALVAIEPATGEILAFVSMPTFDPNLFIEGIDSESWQAIANDPAKPMLNRPLRGTYPPGSTYKPFMALALLTSGLRRPNQWVYDPGYFELAGHRFRDARPGGYGRVDLMRSLVLSSDTYYYGAAYEMGVDAIHDFMKPWGFGQLTGIDLPDEATGVLPSIAWKRERLHRAWRPKDTPSVGVGQGYNAFTILQLAHATATLANHGVAMRPHLVQTVENVMTGARVPVAPERTGTIAVSPEAMALVRSAMVKVNSHGTAREAFAGAEYVSGGKTGTSQVIAIKQDERYDAKKLATRFHDHSLFIAFAPYDKPRIALALIVENGGFGAKTAAPIARHVLDYYLLGKLPKNQTAPLAPLPDSPDMRDVPEVMQPEPAAPGATVGAG